MTTHSAIFRCDKYRWNYPVVADEVLVFWDEFLRETKGPPKLQFVHDRWKYPIDVFANRKFILRHMSAIFFAVPPRFQDAIDGCEIVGSGLRIRVSVPV